MPLINKDSIKSFLGGKSFLVADVAPAGFDSAIAQAEDMVYQFTGISAPADIANAIPQLQFYAHCIFQYIVSGQQDGLSDAEMTRRKDMYDSAMNALNKISRGELNIYNSDGTIASRSPSASSSFYYNNGTESSGTVIDRTERL